MCYYVSGFKLTHLSNWVHEKYHLKYKGEYWKLVTNERNTNEKFIIGSEPPQFVKVHGKMIKHHSAFIIDSHFAEAFYLSVFRTGQRERERVFVRWPISICKSWFAKLLFRDLSCRPYSNSVITDNGFTQKEKKLEVKKNYFHLII